MLLSWHVCLAGGLRLSVVPTNTVVIERDPAILHCRLPVAASKLVPSPIFSWLKDKRPLSGLPSSASWQATGSLVGSLRLAHISINDAGAYCCVVFTDSAFDYACATLSVTGVMQHDVLCY